MEKINYKEQWLKEFGEWKARDNKQSPIEAWKALFEGEQYIYIYGAGHLGKVFANCLCENEISTYITSFVDKDPSKNGEEIFGGIQCIVPEKMEKNGLILVTVEKGYEEAFSLCRQYSSKVYCAANPGIGYVNGLQEILNMSGEQLDQIGNNIATVFDWLEDERSKEVYYYLTRAQLFEKPYHSCFEKSFCDHNEYFREEIFDVSKCQRFVDCGAFEGDTLEDYLKFVGNEFEKVNLFEMNSDTVKVLKGKIARYDKNIKDKIEIFEMGVGDKETLIPISTTIHDGMVKIDESGTKYGKINTLDNCLQNRKVDLIKMDIEGAELSALQGASELIKKETPYLAICIYHKLCDLWELPMYIKRLVPNYHFFIRHHSHYYQDMALYAVVDKK